MTDKTKKIFRIVGLCLVAVGAGLVVAFGGSEANVLAMASGAIALVVGGIAFVKSLLK